MRKLRLHWSIHPEKDQDWYEAKAATMTEDAVARELDISYNLSASGTVFKSEFKRDIHVVNSFDVEPTKLVYRTVDYGRVNACLWAQKRPSGGVTIFRELVMDSNTKEQAQAIQGISNDIRCDGFDDFGDPAGVTRSHFDTDTTYEEIMGRYGIRPTHYASSRMRERRKEGIQLVKLKLSERIGGEETIQIVGDACPNLIAAFEFGYRYKTDKEGNVVHNDAIHEEHPYEDVMDCLRYLVCELYQVANNPTYVEPPKVNHYISPYTGY